MTLPTHLIIGPEQHGVVEYGQHLARHTGGPIFRVNSWKDLPSDHRLLPAGPWQIYFTDHLFGETPSEAVARLLALAGGRPLSVSFHDIPQPEEGKDRFAARKAAYIQLAKAADIVVVNSHHEADFFTTQRENRAQIQPHVIPLPIPSRSLLELPEHGDRIDADPQERHVSIMGFIYPGKGHLEFLQSLTQKSHHSITALHALGRIADGHEWLAPELHAAADRAGVELSITGFLEPDELERALHHSDIPVCAHRHFSASGSLMKWLGMGRRVLVADSPYSRELQSRWPDFIVVVENDAWLDAIEALPSDFTQPIDPPCDWTWEHVSSSFHRMWANEEWDFSRNDPRLGVWPDQWPLVSVVIPYFDNPAGLDSMLNALEVQDYPGDFECVIADDGSTKPPRFTAANFSFPIHVVHQEDRGFRAAAARNLGASAAQGSILAFLDGDTVPSPAYLRESARLPILEHRAVVVGKRLHGEVFDSGAAEPEWLREGYAKTGDLANADDSAWRFVISAVLTCHRDLFENIGGFDDTIVGYGGEDWEFAWKAWNAGAVLHRCSAAVAFHPEPDWSGRSTDQRDAFTQKNGESLALAQRIAHPLTRPDSVVFATPQVQVILPPTMNRWEAGVAVHVMCMWLAHPGVHIAVPDHGLTEAERSFFSHDPRVSIQTQLSSAPVQLQIYAPTCPRSIADFRSLYARLDSLGGEAAIYSLEKDEADKSAMLGRIHTARRMALTAAGITPFDPVRVYVSWPHFGLTRRIERDFAGW